MAIRKANPQLPDNFQVPFYITELDAKGAQVMDPGDSASVTIADPNSGTVAADAAVDPTKVPSPLDPAKVLLTGFLVAGTGGLTLDATATFAHNDGTVPPPPLTASFDVTAGAPAVGGFGFGAPVPQ